MTLEQLDAQERDRLLNQARQEIRQQIRVSFGDRPYQELHVEVASEMLTRLRIKNPKQWGDILREILIEDVPAPAQRKQP